MPTGPSTSLETSAGAPPHEVLVITGAGGIGRAVALRGGPDRTVLLGDVSQEARDRVAAELHAAGIGVVTHVLDMTSRTSIRSFAAHASALGTVTRLVHTAGVSQSQAASDQILRINLWGTAALFEEFSDVLADGSAVVAVASSAAHWAAAVDKGECAALATVPADELLTLPVVAGVDRTATTAYSFSKYANQLRVQGQAAGWRARGIRINSVSPGLISTPMGELERSASGGVLDGILSDIPAGRMGDAAEVAAAVMFLLSPDATYVQGTDLLVDGGWTGATDSGAIPTPAEVVRAAMAAAGGTGRTGPLARVVAPVSAVRKRIVEYGARTVTSARRALGRPPGRQRDGR